MKKPVLVLMLSLTFAASAAAQGGLVSVKSGFDVTATANRLERILAEKGVTLFARIDHAEGARSVGQTLAPTLLLIFGNPAMGTPLIQRSRSMGIDLPLKALIWQDSAGQVWLTYNEPDYLARRHGLTEMNDTLEKMQQALAAFAAAATQPQ